MYRSGDDICRCCVVMKENAAAADAAADANDAVVLIKIEIDQGILQVGSSSIHYCY